jgi:hypothetical protein
MANQERYFLLLPTFYPIVFNIYFIRSSDYCRCFILSLEKSFFIRLFCIKIGANRAIQEPLFFSSLALNSARISPPLSSAHRASGGGDAVNQNGLIRVTTVVTH